MRWLERKFANRYRVTRAGQTYWRRHPRLCFFDCGLFSLDDAPPPLQSCPSDCWRWPRSRRIWRAGRSWWRWKFSWRCHPLSKGTGSHKLLSAIWHSKQITRWYRASWRSATRPTKRPSAYEHQQLGGCQRWRLLSRSTREKLSLRYKSQPQRQQDWRWHRWWPKWELRSKKKIKQHTKNIF